MQIKVFGAYGDTGGATTSTWKLIERTEYLERAFEIDPGRLG